MERGIRLMKVEIEEEGGGMEEVERVLEYGKKRGGIIWNERKGRFGTWW